MLEIHSKRRLTCLPTDNPYLHDNWLPTDTECDITTGPICNIILPGHIPIGAHAC